MTDKSKTAASNSQPHYDPMADIKKTPRNRDNETYLYISPAHKAKLKAYTAQTKRNMRAEAELWIDGLKVK